MSGQLRRKCRYGLAICMFRRYRPMSGGSIVSEDNNTSMWLVRSDHRAFVCKPLEIPLMSRIMVFDSPLLNSVEVKRTLSLCILCYKGPQGTTENGDISREVITSPIEQDKRAQSRVTQPLRPYSTRKIL
jgi:hypothetical protein